MRSLSTSVLVLALAAGAGAPTVLACDTFRCCWDQLIGNVNECGDRYRPERETDLAARERVKLQLQMCLTSAEYGFYYCLGTLDDRSSGMAGEPGSAPGPAPKPVHHGHPIYVTSAPAPRVHAYDLSVSESEAGPWRLDLLNGGPDRLTRVTGEVRVDGRLVLDALELDGGVQEMSVPIFLEAGHHRVELRLSRVEREPAGAPAWLFAYLVPEAGD